MRPYHQKHLNYQLSLAPAYRHLSRPTFVFYKSSFLKKGGESTILFKKFGFRYLPRSSLNDQRTDEVWKEVVQSKDPKDRLKFITFVGPKLQEKINRKRIELIRPLDELEVTIKNKLESEYDQTRAINSTLTAFLQSASKVEENRKRYLEMIGVTDKEVDKFVNETDQAVSELVDAARNIEDRAKDAEKYREKIKGILDKLRK